MGHGDDRTRRILKRGGVGVQCQPPTFYPNIPLFKINKSPDRV